MVAPGVTYTVVAQPLVYVVKLLPVPSGGAPQRDLEEGVKQMRLYEVVVGSIDLSGWFDYNYPCISARLRYSTMM